MPNIDLNNLQKKALMFFGQDKFGNNFYWTGGTLLSYHYLKHRYSIDLDFFSAELYHDDEYIIFVNRLKKHLGIKDVKYTLKQNRRIVTFQRNGENLKLEMVYFPFESMKKHGMLDKYKVQVDSLVDIMTNKVLSTYQRFEIKDVYDLYFYLKGKQKTVDLSGLIQNVEKKFGITIEKTILISKINTLLADIDKIRPFLVENDSKIGLKIKEYFQKEFNTHLDTKLT